MDFLKEFADAWSQRIRSPIVGSVLLSFLVFNWKPIWYLLFADRPTRQKFLFFDANTDWLSLLALPLFVGVVLAVLMPWIKFFGAYAARAPTSLLGKIQHDSSHDQMIYELNKEMELVEAKANLQAAREKAAIDAASRLEEAERVGGEELKKSLEGDREEIKEQEGSFNADEKLDELELALLIKISFEESGKYELIEDHSGFSLYIGDSLYSTPIRKNYLKVKSALEHLWNRSLIDKYESALTEHGYQESEKLTQFNDQSELQAFAEKQLSKLLEKTTLDS